MCVSDRHDMTLAVKVALNPNTTNQPNLIYLRIASLTRGIERVKLPEDFVKFWHEI